MPLEIRMHIAWNYLFANPGRWVFEELVECRYRTMALPMVAGTCGGMIADGPKSLARFLGSGVIRLAVS